MAVPNQRFQPATANPSPAQDRIPTPPGQPPPADRGDPSGVGQRPDRGLLPAGLSRPTPRRPSRHRPAAPHRAPGLLRRPAHPHRPRTSTKEVVQLRAHRPHQPKDPRPTREVSTITRNQTRKHQPELDMDTDAVGATGHGRPMSTPPVRSSSRPFTTRRPAGTRPSRHSAPGLGPAAPPIVRCCHRQQRSSEVVSYSAWAVDRLAHSGSARSSWLRELMSSLVNTLRRWYSTVRGLMNSWAPISGFDRPSRRAARSAPPGR